MSNKLKDRKVPCHRAEAPLDRYLKPEGHHKKKNANKTFMQKRVDQMKCPEMNVQKFESEKRSPTFHQSVVSIPDFSSKCCMANVSPSSANVRLIFERLVKKGPEVNAPKFESEKTIHDFLSKCSTATVYPTLVSWKVDF